ncbi:flagellar basal body-associated FliL family protein [Fodinicurvata sp. EGI_FJ10296]|uniref:flagellar basal body-associated FliL family protein n=1 Tax=Fodinicurvata sp. EGI_FJ10296 TaxID=3231908 RepID=UPI003453AD6A
MTSDTMDQAFDDAVAKLPRKKMSGKKLVLFIILPLLVVLGMAAGLYVTGALSAIVSSFSSAEAAVEEEQPVDPSEPGYYYELPDMLVNLNTGDRRQHFLRLQISLELARESDVEHVERVLPRIIDQFQVYLRELDVTDLQGSAGLYRLREELLRRVSNQAEPAEVRDVLFREMLVQ